MVGQAWRTRQAQLRKVRREACERELCTGSRPESGAGHASGRDEHLALHAPALTMALLLEGCCSRSASAAVSMAHVTLARVSAVWGRCASGAAVGGRSSDCCIAALMRAGRQLPLAQNREKIAIRVQERSSPAPCIHNNSMGKKVANEGGSRPSPTHPSPVLVLHAKDCKHTLEHISRAQDQQARDMPCTPPLSNQSNPQRPR